MTRTPDVHFLAEARHNGAKVTVFSPDFSQVAEVRRLSGFPLHAGQDGAFWMAVNHVILKEFHHQAKCPTSSTTSSATPTRPFLVELRGRRPAVLAPPGGCCGRASSRATSAEENGDWKFLVWDEASGQPRMPHGHARLPLGAEEGRVEPADERRPGRRRPRSGAVASSTAHDDVLQVAFDDFADGNTRAARRAGQRTWKRAKGRISGRPRSSTC